MSLDPPPLGRLPGQCGAMCERNSGPSILRLWLVVGWLRYLGSARAILCVAGQVGTACEQNVMSEKKFAALFQQFLRYKWPANEANTNILRVPPRPGA